MGGWVRLRGDVKEEPVKEAHLLALVDAWPPALLPYLKKPAPGSTLTWTIEFVQPLRDLSTLDWCQYLADIEYAADGYGHVAAKLWSAEGRVDCHESPDRHDLRLTQCRRWRSRQARHQPPLRKKRGKVRNCSTSRREMASLRSLNGSEACASRLWP
jgi:hypothetical protein